ncbi:MAG TPA: DUF3560 domain-containing protein, partial [Catenuloplanes sp.]
KAIRDGWRFSRHIGEQGTWYLPHTRDRNADRARLERLAAALHEAGYQAEIEVDNTPRDAAAIEADRAERVAGRVERYTELADARHTCGGARLDHVTERRSHIPLAQPVISPRFGNYLRRLNRTEASARAEVAVGDHWQHRAQAAESTQRYRLNPRVITRRINRLDADHRRWQRSLDTLRAAGERGEYADGGWYADRAAEAITRAEQEIARLDGQLAYWRAELTALEARGAWQPWTREHFRVGDEAKVIGTWYPVLRVNGKSVTVTPLVLMGQPSTSSWTDTARYDKIHGRRRDGKTLHTPPPPPEATCTERVTAPINDADVITESDGDPCAGTPVARVTVRHDGVTCGCQGRCMTPDPDEPDGPAAERWTEVLLLCAGHRNEYTHVLGTVPDATTVEDLT